MSVCACCQLPQRELFCARCLQEGIATHQQLFRGLAAQRTGSVARAARLLDPEDGRGIADWRRMRAQVADTARRCEALKAAIVGLELDVARAVTARDLSSRKETLARASTQNFSDDLRCSIRAANRQQADVARKTLHARKVLVREAIAVFGVRQRPSSEWEIAGLTLPPPDAMRVLPAININAALLHVVHLSTLVSKYLSISLPFSPTFPSHDHVGRPTMRANLPFVSTTKYRDNKQVLWMSSSANPERRDARSAVKHRQFLTAFGLLAHSIAYLAWSQEVEGVGVPQGGAGESSDSSDQEVSTILIPAWSLLHLLHAISTSPALGRKSHEPGTLALRHIGFGLDVSQVVRAVHDADERRWGDGEQSEGWDMVEG